MTRYLGESDYEHGSAERVGVLLTNLGTPDSPTSAAVRRYLAEFLSDPRVIELPRALWWPILHGVILRVRPARSARAYRTVWSDEGSPLLVNAERQRRALQSALDQHMPGPFRVELAMRYGAPSIPQGLERLRSAGARRLLVLPLYPQYSATTTGSTFDAVAAVLTRWRWLPEFRFVNQYHDDPGYVQAVVASIRDHQRQHGEAKRLLFSFHGLPRRYLLSGDPYHCQCLKTARLVAEVLGLDRERWQVSFQSRVGREEWLRPYTDETLKAWGAEGLESVQVVCPGFSADCLETLEEIGEQNREFFRESGGGDYSYVPALNDRVDHIRILTDLVRRHSQGWPESTPREAAALRAESEATRERALAMGAVR